MSPLEFPALANKRMGLILGLVLWLGAVGVGMLAMASYELKPGVANTSLSRWPGQAPLTFDSGRSNLVLFAHPRCPCTQATLTQLQQIAARCGEKINLKILFYQPAGESPTWGQTPLWQMAASIPNATVMDDPDGELARQFGAATSGQALLFDEEGKLMFSGGITGARGHEGDNPGQSRILALVFQGEPESTSNSSETALAKAVQEESGLTNTAVFGCSIVDATSGAAGTR